MEIENKDYYFEQLKHQVSFLVDSCNSYDKGNFSQAKNLSTYIRTLVKDPPNINSKNRTISLLTHLNEKVNMKFYNTGFEPKDVKMNISLVGLVNVPDRAPYITQQFNNIYLPLLDYSEAIDVKWLTFEQWWNSIIVYSDAENFPCVFTRKKIVLTMSEQDGGAHIDSISDIDKEYLALSTASKSLFYNNSHLGKEVPIVYMHYALVRQIAHELIISIKNQFNLHIKYKPTNKFNLRGVDEKNIKQPPMLVQSDKIESTRTNNPYKIADSSTSIIVPPNAAYMKIFF